MTKVDKHSGGPVSSVVAFTDTSYRKTVGSIDLNELVVKNPSATFFMKVDGHDWQDRGISDGDVLIIDRSLSPKRSDILIVEKDGELGLLSNSEIDEEVIFWGVVTHIIRKVR